MKTIFKNILFAICIFFFCGYTYSIGYQMFFNGIRQRADINKIWYVSIVQDHVIFRNYELNNRPIIKDNYMIVEDKSENVKTTYVGFNYIIDERTIPDDEELEETINEEGEKHDTE